MKKILFVIDSLECAGAEKSLVTLLSLLDYKKYSVDLMLFGHGGALEKLVPSEVNILSPLEYTHFSKLELKDALLYSLKKLDYKMLSSRLKYSLKILKKKYRNAEKARIYWESISGVIEKNSTKYDVAISYAQGVPTFYVAEKVEAKTKFAWVNVSYKLDSKNKIYQQKFYNQYKKIVAVSDSTKEILLETFPEYEQKIKVIYDIIDPSLINEMAYLGEGYNDNFNGIRLLTIGRLDKQKGYDIALKACKRLKENGINFRWYVLGKGPLKSEIVEQIKQYSLEEHFILLGVKANPYPFIKDCDIYVQTSKFEGFGLAIAEARILNKPVVTTRFDAVFNQMIDGKNGLVVDIDSGSVCDGVLKIINNSSLREGIINYLKMEKKGNLNEVQKFYKLII